MSLNTVALSSSAKNTIMEISLQNLVTLIPCSSATVVLLKGEQSSEFMANSVLFRYRQPSGRRYKIEGIRIGGVEVRVLL